VNSVFHMKLVDFNEMIYFYSLVCVRVLWSVKSWIWAPVLFSDSFSAPHASFGADRFFPFTAAVLFWLGRVLGTGVGFVFLTGSHRRLSSLLPAQIEFPATEPFPRFPTRGTVCWIRFLSAAIYIFFVFRTGNAPRAFRWLGLLISSFGLLHGHKFSAQILISPR
jgi:hypothetical protein